MALLNGFSIFVLRCAKKIVQLRVKKEIHNADKSKNTFWSFSSIIYISKATRLIWDHKLQTVNVQQTANSDIVYWVTLQSDHEVYQQGCLMFHCFVSTSKGKQIIQSCINGFV